MRGKLIVITGIDGSGKTVQTKLLYDRLKKEGYPVETIDYPRYSETFFGDLVGRYLRGEFGTLDSVSPYLAATLFAGDRFETRDTLEGWLNDGKIVLANRYVADNIAHQGARVGVVQDIDKFAEWLGRLEYDVYKMPKADINILLSIPPAIAYKLVAEKTDRSYLKGRKRDIHEEDSRYLETASRCFHRLALQPDWRIVECADDHDNLLSETSIADKVWDYVAGLINANTISAGSVPSFAPGTMGALRIINNWDGQRDITYVLAEWCERDGEMQWCRWPEGGRVLDYIGDDILDVWILEKQNTFSNSDIPMTKQEKSLLLHLETRATEYGGLVNSVHISAEDMGIVKRWNESGFVRFGRLASDCLPRKDSSTNWCELSDRAWEIAHIERRERHKRLYSQREWRKSKEEETPT